MGDHAKCVLHSFVCARDEAWSRPYVSTMLDLVSVNQIITPTPDDRDKLRKIMNIRLSRRAVSMTFKNTTQNKCEAVNRGITKSVPKHLTFKQNYGGKGQASINSINNGPAHSLLTTLTQLKPPIPPKSPVIKYLKSVDNSVIMQKYRKKSIKYRFRRLALQKKRYRDYDEKAKRLKGLTYKKAAAVLDDLMPPVHSATKDHSYSLRSKRCTSTLQT